MTALIYSCLAFYTVGAVTSVTESQPHVIVIVADDLGWDDVSFHGSPQIPTPNIDKLAYEGTILNNYYVQPLCTPSRAALMTGRHPIQLGLQSDVIMGAEPYGLGLNETLLPQELKKLGYATHIVGKWHLGFFAKEYTPSYRGFDSHFGYWMGKQDYYDYTTIIGNYWGYGLRRNMYVDFKTRGKYSTEAFTEEAVNIINQHNKSQPMFLYLPYQAVHGGNQEIQALEAPEKYMKRFPHIQDKHRRTYAAMVSALDDAVGNVTAALYETGILDNAIIIFTTDNGGPSAGLMDGNYASNWPLRGTKVSLWEGGVRGVGFVWSKRYLKNAPKVSNQLMHISDWFPTILNAVGGNATNPDLYGINMWQTLQHNLSSPRDEIILNIDPQVNYSALRYGDYKIISGEVRNGKLDGWFQPEDITGNRDVKMMEWLEINTNQHSRKESMSLFPQFMSHTEKQNVISLKQKDRDILQHTIRDQSVKVNCGPRPTNASTNCKPAKKPCLFNIRSDPCEFNNLAELYPKIYHQLLARLKNYADSAVKPHNKPSDPKGNPANFGNVWTPWVELTQD